MTGPERCFLVLLGFFFGYTAGGCAYEMAVNGGSGWAAVGGGCVVAALSCIGIAVRGS